MFQFTVTWSSCFGEAKILTGSIHWSIATCLMVIGMKVKWLRTRHNPQGHCPQNGLFSTTPHCLGFHDLPNYEPISGLINSAIQLWYNPITSPMNIAALGTKKLTYKPLWGVLHFQIITIIISYVAFYLLDKTGLLGKELPLPWVLTASMLFNPDKQSRKKSDCWT